jgi:hypothetical protein
LLPEEAQNAECGNAREFARHSEDPEQHGFSEVLQSAFGPKMSLADAVVSF